MSRAMTGNHIGDNATIHQGDIYNRSPHEDNKCLADLRVTDPRDDKARIEDTKGGLLKDSYRWILDHEHFRQWRDDERSRLLWIKGDPGKGKTMLLCGIIDELSPQTRLEDQKASTLLAYFFYQANDSRINTATAMLRGLIYLLVKQQISLVSYIEEKYKDAGKELFEDINAWTALSGMLKNILHDPSLDSVYIIIDALDECVNGLPQLLNFINITSAFFPYTKWIISSRNWPDIEERLDAANTQHARLCLELNEKSIAAAISAYTEYKVNQLARQKKYNAGTRDTVQSYLLSNANDTFLWVSLVCQNLEEISRRKTLEKLKAFPPGLDALYQRMMQRIRNLKDDHDRGICYHILAAVLLVYRPVTLAELGTLIGEDPVDSESLQESIGLCGSFLTVRNGRIYIIHQSVKDYLSDEAAPAIFPSGLVDVHGALFLQSVQVMATTLRRNIYDIHPSGIKISDIKVPDPDPLAAIRYSCVHWIDHFCEMYNNYDQSQVQIDTKMSKEAYLFLKKCFLYWLEALGLIRHIKDGVFSIIRLEKLLRRTSRDQLLLEFTRDSCQFIRKDSSLIANSPLQVYASALVFSPSNSLIRRVFTKEEPQWLKTKPIVEFEWNSCSQTLYSSRHRFASIAFSADSRYLASTSASSIRIWDVVMEKELQILEGHRHQVTSVIFLDNNHIASGSDDKTIKIWDITTGKNQKTLKGHGRPVCCIAVSDSHYLASGSIDGTIKIWDPTTGEELRTFRSHSNELCSVAFLHGDYLASGSADNTIKIWDIHTSEEQKTLWGHEGWVQSIVFSGDRYLASGSIDSTVKIWELITGSEIQTLKGHERAVTSVAFSPDGRYLVSGSSDHTLKIWDVKTGENKQTLKGHQKGVIAVAFSADGTYLASASSDSTIKIWDITIGQDTQVMESHGDSVQSLAFSADGNYLASGSDDSTIKIWDTTGKEKQTLEGHRGPIDLVVFSPDGYSLASVSHDRTIKIWDIKTGEEKHAIRHEGWVRSVAFSSDSNYLASGADDRTIKIWDIKTGKDKQTFKGHAGRILSVAFSADGNFLASGSGDRRVMIWDITTGEKKHTLRSHKRSVDLVTFSADGRYLASWAHDYTIRIWDATTWIEEQTLEVESVIRTILFDSTASCLYTNVGLITLNMKSRIKDPSAATAQVSSSTLDLANQHSPKVWDVEKAEPHGYGLSADYCWITWNGDNIFWLPPEYRPSQLSQSHKTPFVLTQRLSMDVRMALSTNSHRVVVFGMLESGPSSL